MTESSDTKRLLELTAQIVSAHVAHNAVSTDAVPGLINAVYGTLGGLGGSHAKAETKPLHPAVPIKQSVFPDYIVCLEDGKRLKMLKRHLATSYNMTPDEYRHKWGLPSDYPMVAPNYTATRSSLAKMIGLGRKPATAPAAEPAEEEEDGEVPPPRRKPGRRRPRN